ncbi:MAG: two-component system, cell cycle response regulator CpdR [Gaiellaceae bacterium]|nr:two-component system, cell cycle response regulator CpdR [Gaiellaceae bacterium]
MMPRVLIAEPNEDVRALLALTVNRLGYEAVHAGSSADVDAVLLEPGCPVGRSVLTRFGDSAPPVVCLSIYPRNEDSEPPSSVAHLTKPASSAAIGAALRVALRHLVAV